MPVPYSVCQIIGSYFKARAVTGTAAVAVTAISYRKLVIGFGSLSFNSRLNE